MSRETAVTEEISYNTEQCHICDEEVVVDNVSTETIEPTGYAVLLGEGNITHEYEDAGNWDEEFHFELEKDETQLPMVKGYIICEICAQAVHQYSPNDEAYTGTIPSELRPTPKIGRNTSNKELFKDYNIGRTIVYLVIALVVLILILGLI